MSNKFDRLDSFEGHYFDQTGELQALQSISMPLAGRQHLRASRGCCISTFYELQDLS